MQVYFPPGFSGDDLPSINKNLSGRHLLFDCVYQVFQSKAEEDEKRIAGLEKDLKDARDKAETADVTYEVMSG